MKPYRRYPPPFRQTPLVEGRRRKRTTPVEVASLVVLVAVTSAVVALSLAAIAWAISTL
jgi:hypothetical protein